MGIDGIRNFLLLALMMLRNKGRKSRKMKKATKSSGSSDVRIQRNTRVDNGRKQRQGVQPQRIVTPVREKSANVPEDLMFFDTRHSTPRAKGTLQRNQEQGAYGSSTNVFQRFENRVQKAFNRHESFSIPFSIDFLSLVLPRGATAGAGVDMEIPSIASVSDIEEESCTISLISGQTVLAKDRVRETISSTFNIDCFFNSSPRSSDAFPFSNHQDVPVNVDFVMESTEDELAAFSNSLIRSGNFRDAIDIYETVLDHYRNTHKQDHRLIISTIHNLSVVHTWNGNYGNALVYCNEALKLRRIKYGEGHKELVSSLCEMAILHYARENFNRALGALREALQIESKAITFNKGESRVGRILNNIGCIHYSMGKLDASLTAFEECLGFQRNIMGSAIGPEVDHVLFNISIVLTNAATVTAKMGDRGKAASLMEEGLIVQQSVLPDDHRIISSVKKSLCRLDRCEQDQEKMNLNGLQIEIEMSQERHGEKSVAPIISNFPDDLNSYCSEMLSLGPTEKEFSSEERVQLHMNITNLPQALLAEGRSKQHCSWVDVGKHQKKTSDGEFNFFEISHKAATYIKQNEVPKAIRVFEKIRRSHKTKCGDVTFILGALNHMLGLIYLHTADYERALISFRDSLKIRQSVLDMDHADVLTSLTMVAITMIAIKDFDGAHTKLEKVLRLTRKKYGYSHEKVAIVLNNIGLCHYELGGVRTASKTFEEAVEILRDVTNTPIEATHLIQVSVMLGRSLNSLAFIRCKREEYAGAIVAQEEALKLQRRMFGNGHAVVKDTIKSLAMCMSIANCQNNKEKLEHMTNLYTGMLS